MSVIVNGEKIDDNEIQNEVERLRPQYEKAFNLMDEKEREAQLIEWSKENLIEKTLLHQDIKKNEPKISNEKLDSVLENLKKESKDPKELYKDFDVENEENLKQRLELIIQVRQKFEELHQEAPEPSIADIKKYYNENQEHFRQKERIRVAHIVKYFGWQSNEANAYQEISKAFDELQNGIAFELLVDKYTDCADSGGDLGYISKGEMVEEFEDVVFNLGTGQVSNIFRTRYGYHIAKVYDKKASFIPELEKVKNQIVDILKNQLQNKVVYDYLDNLKNKATIEEINTELKKE